MILRGSVEDFAGRMRGVVADKGYVSKDFAEEMWRRGVVFLAVRRVNMVRSEVKGCGMGFFLG